MQNALWGVRLFIAGIPTKKLLLIMKLTAIILLTACLAASAKGHSQNVTVTLKDAPLEKAFAEIKRQTGYGFVYKTDLLEHAAPISISVKSATLQEVLDLCFKNQPLTYKVFQGFIVVKSKDDPSNDDNISLPPPPIDVHGRVVNEKGEPVVGASVKIKGSDKGTSTNENGEFTLPNVDANATLVISGVNIETFEIKVNSRTDLATLSAKIKIAEGEAVTVTYSNGYQLIPKERATGSFAIVDSALFNKRVSTDFISRLDGNVSGLIFNKNTNITNGGGTDISIRGHNTLFANDQPLIVVDNFAYDGNLNNINPNDIESITVLKDAAAASIWGVRSGNGVIVVTTKRGKNKGKPSLSLNSNITSTDKLNPFTDPNFLDASSYIDIEQTLFNSGYYNGTLNNRNTYVSPAVQIMADQRAGRISASDATAKLNLLRSQDVRRDVSKYFYRAPLTQQYNVNLSGGTSNSDYYMSLGYDNLLSGTIGNKNDRLTIMSNYDYSPLKNLTVSLDYNLILLKAVSNGGQGLYNTMPYLQYADADGNALTVADGFSNYYKDSMARLGYINMDYKPLAERNNINNTTKTTDNRIVLGVKYKFLKNFNLNVKYQYQKSNGFTQNFNGDSSYYTRSLIDKFATRSSTGIFTYPVPLGSIISQNYVYQTNKQGRAEFNYKQLFHGQHDISASVGAEIRQNVVETASNLLYGYNYLTGNTNAQVDFADNLPVHPTGTAKIPGNSNGITKTTNNFISYYGNASYTLKNLYTFFASGRIDHSNFFGVKTNQKAVPLYSVGLSWNLSKEQFYHIAWLPYLRPRATIGYDANVNTSASGFTTILQNTNSPYSGLNWDRIVNPGNPQLQWEKTRIINFALDYGLKNNIVSGSIEYYIKKGYNLFGYSPLAPSTGLTQFFGNTANTAGHGLDLTVNTHNINKRDWKWNTSFLISFAKDKVTKYDVKNTVSYYIQQSSGGSLTPLAGAPEYALYAYHFAGLTHATGDPQGIVNGQPSTDYNTILSNNSFDSIPYIGSARPTVFGSIRNDISWKGFSVSFLISYRLNYYFRRSSVSDAQFVTLRNAGNKDYYQRWQKPGDEAITNIPSIRYAPFDGNRATFYAFSDALVEKGDQVRFQEISLDYDFVKSKYKWLPFADLQLYGYIGNLGILWRANKKGIDPDAPSGMKLPRSYACGVKVNF